MVGGGGWTGRTGVVNDDEENTRFAHCTVGGRKIERKENDNNNNKTKETNTGGDDGALRIIRFRHNGPARSTAVQRNFNNNSNNTPASALYITHAHRDKRACVRACTLRTEWRAVDGRHAESHTDYVVNVRTAAAAVGVVRAPTVSLLSAAAT
jgi:hypothetical protein